ncbi:hypothetical protein Nepgr_025350 [Nepenthes gracilis]|uniref:Uncharacterized protein n=1 Tax=Nepenthes gracilis TaxID=150966 RepID=A0AAD3T7I2_NEPGR|nr:hypothetical protein Nepgr_025350 [Nepenthes gracilis]
MILAGANEFITTTSEHQNASAPPTGNNGSGPKDGKNLRPREYGLLKHESLFALALVLPLARVCSLCYGVCLQLLLKFQCSCFDVESDAPPAGEWRGLPVCGKAVICCLLPAYADASPDAVLAAVMMLPLACCFGCLLHVCGCSMAGKWLVPLCCVMKYGKCHVGL